MKRLFFTFILATICGISVFAYDFSSVCSTGQTLYYNITSSTAPYTVSMACWNSDHASYNDIEIPESVVYNGVTYSVTSIAPRAFSWIDDLWQFSVTIPNSVTTICDTAFDYCRGLISVEIGNSVTSIGNMAFWGSVHLTSVTIPNSVTNIGYRAFWCNGLTSVTIPNSVTSIGEEAFADCGLTSVTIGNSVTNIGDNAFMVCRGLTSVYYTGDIAGWCGISFGTSSSNPLCYAHNLYIDNSLVTDLVIPNTVTEIKNYTFNIASCLTSLTFPNSVTSIGDYAFYGCSGITGELIMPNSITSIGEEAFYYCSGLTGTLTIPNSVTSLGSRAFYGCNGLTILNFNAENCTDGSSLISSNTLTKITIGENVTTIPNYAFSGCTSLDSIISYAANPPVIYGGTFDSQLSLNTPVVVPCGTVETYEEADFWYSFRHIQQSADCDSNGIDDDYANEIALFPNPATDILNITSSETISEIKIVNTLGQVVKRIEVNAGNAVCNVEDLKAGVYIVKISTASATLSQRRFIKE